MAPLCDADGAGEVTRVDVPVREAPESPGGLDPEPVIPEVVVCGAEECAVSSAANNAFSASSQNKFAVSTVGCCSAHCLNCGSVMVISETSTPVASPYMGIMDSKAASTLGPHDCTAWAYAFTIAEAVDFGRGTPVSELIVAYGSSRARRTADVPVHSPSKTEVARSLIVEELRSLPSALEPPGVFMRPER